MLGGFSLGISGVFVIESLGPDDKLKTGVEVHANAVSPHGRRARVYVDPVRKADNPGEFFAHLASIADVVAAEHVKPIVQIDCHGSERGFSIGRRLVSWEQLVPALCEINRASRMNLFVIAAACDGAHLLQALSQAFRTQRGFYRGRAPIRACWGHHGSVMDRTLLASLSEFYRCLLGVGDSVAAWRAISAGYLVTADNILRSARNVLSEPKLVDDRVDHFHSRLGGNREAVRRRYFDVMAGVRKRYLWLDEFPENETTFREPHDLTETGEPSVPT